MEYRLNLSGEIRWIEIPLSREHRVAHLILEQVEPRSRKTVALVKRKALDPLDRKSVV